ncbi:amino acid ABC transporter ATP-binding/permease protein [Donghicola mangrovi]|uniref:ATP-binding cassette domain-containing protein n=1 Tax=Donghicola mangrovi TaxID=2729614 RepID=A0A850Q862_9RHOB|nr:ATP-binding cassette domain-containing protein [Donghicola mangrovi]NVO22715.1 ATP-binding cassette domain-containing protein [Donghicola mangrovi]
MTSMKRVLKLCLGSARGAMVQGGALTVLVLLAGVGLLALSGWFITAAAAAGLAGAGLAFEVFRPSAGVRALALGRTGARYGERLLTHDATLKALVAVRLRLLRGLMSQPLRRLERARAGAALNRLIADVDALDGVTLRLFLPAVAGALTLIVAVIGLAVLVSGTVALWIGAVYGIGALGIGLRFGPQALPVARRAERALQAVRARTNDAFAARADLTVYNALDRQIAHAGHAANALAKARAHRDGIERAAQFWVTATVQTAVAGALGLGFMAVTNGVLSAPLAMTGVLAALALSEALMPLARGISEFGRIADSARRVMGDIPETVPELHPRHDAKPMVVPPLDLRSVAIRPLIDTLSLTVEAGEMALLAGPSGVGKTTVLNVIAGLLPPDRGKVCIGGTPLADHAEEDLRGRLGFVPQRTTVMDGTLMDSLRLGNAALTEAEAWHLLDIVQMAGFAKSRDGLQTRLGSRGNALSGGERRRVALARAIAGRPPVLLMDEPTEGLDEATATTVLKGIRAYLPKSAILIASHRACDRALATRVITLR